jgi:hypothetical protein
MRIFRKLDIRVLAALVVAIVSFMPHTAFAQTDDIQVYDGGLADVGKFNLTLHNNFTPKGAQTGAFPGAIIPDNSLNGVPEWAYGVTKWFEAGLYLPLYSIAKVQHGKINGVKLRTLFAVPNADDRKFFYGVNFEFSINAKHWDERRFTSEVRPIVGWHLHPVDIIINPILDTNYTGGIKSLEFAPSTRVAYNYSKKSAVAIEEYADYGQLRNFVPGSQQAHQIFAVFDHSGKFMDVEIGAGIGVTSASDKFTLKLILSRDLN